MGVGFQKGAGCLCPKSKDLCREEKEEALWFQSWTLLRHCLWAEPPLQESVEGIPRSPACGLDRLPQGWCEKAQGLPYRQPRALCNLTTPQSCFAFLWAREEGWGGSDRAVLEQWYTWPCTLAQCLSHLEGAITSQNYHMRTCLAWPGPVAPWAQRGPLHPVGLLGSKANNYVPRATEDRWVAWSSGPSSIGLWVICLFLVPRKLKCPLYLQQGQ